MTKKKKEKPKVPVPRRFYLERSADKSGISGTGFVATGILFPSGKVVIEWIVGDCPSTEQHDSLDNCMEIHGHGDATRVVWIDQLDMVLSEKE